MRNRSCALLLPFALATLACSTKMAAVIQDAGSPGQDAGLPSDAGCALDAGTAFCDTFEEGPSAPQGRTGDLDSSRWSAARLSPQQDSAPGQADPSPLGPIPACRASLTKSSIYPDEDTLICDATGGHSHELLTAAVMQNYGQNSYRIRQPFDFAGRTGKIVFDVDALMVDGSGLAASAWVSVEITEDPIPTASFIDPERGTVPRNGVEIHFNNDQCPQGFEKGISVGQVDVYTNYNHSDTAPTYPASWTTPDCVGTTQGQLNHFEIDLSQTAITVFGSDPSPDGGKTFPNFHEIAAGSYSLAFTRGWVHITARNHATNKYFSLHDWVYHWDNVGFDGPVISNWREYDIPDSLTPSSATDPLVCFGLGCVNTGYILRDSSGPNGAGIYTCCAMTLVPNLQFEGVDLTGVTSAKVALNTFYLVNPAFNPPADFTTMDLRYRFNGGTWRDRFITADEATVLQTDPDNFQQGVMSQIIDVPLGDLQQGTNTLELTTVNQLQQFPNVVSNIDLVLQTTP